MGLWIPLVLFYGLAKGARDTIKKKALQKSSIAEILLLHTALAFLFVIPFSHGIFSVPVHYLFYIFLKAFAVFVAWICAFTSIKHMPISYYGVVDMARMLFATVLAILFLNEQMTLFKSIGLTLVVIGVVAVNFGNGSDDKRIKYKYLIIVICSCLFNAISGFIDKKILMTGVIDSSQLQFWYMGFLVLLYGVYALFTRSKISLKSLKTNYWIVILSILFVIADRALFIANEDMQSQVTVMTLIKQSSVLVSVLCGKLFFKEKHILKRAICAFIVLTGIIFAII